jgi:hypothetical protein
MKAPKPCPEDIIYTPWFSNIKSNANNTPNRFLKNNTPNQPCHRTIKKEMMNCLMSTTETTVNIPFPFSFGQIILRKEHPFENTKGRS